MCQDNKIPVTSTSSNNFYTFYNTSMHPKVTQWFNATIYFNRGNVLIHKVLYIYKAQL